MNTFTIAAAATDHWASYESQGKGKGKHSPVPEFSNFGLAFTILIVTGYGLLKFRVRKNRQ